MGPSNEIKVLQPPSFWETPKCGEALPCHNLTGTHSQELHRDIPRQQRACAVLRSNGHAVPSSTAGQVLCHAKPKEGIRSVLP